MEKTYTHNHCEHSSKIRYNLQTTRKNMREYEIDQVCQRFCIKADEQNIDRSKKLNIILKPSDPDFVYEITELKFCLFVPLEYPHSALPYLVVKNNEIPVGFKANVERGFSELVKRNQGCSLSEYITMLDDRLERILSGDKTETVKIVRNKGNRLLDSTNLTANLHLGPPRLDCSSSLQVDDIKKPSPSSSLVVSSPTTSQYVPMYNRRSREVRQLEARMKTSPVFLADDDRCTFILPLDPHQRDLLPVSLQPIKSVRMIVPLEYNIMPVRIELPGFPLDIVKRVTRGFEHYIKENPEASLMALINVLGSRLYMWAIEKADTTKISKKGVRCRGVETQYVKAIFEQEAIRVDNKTKPHIQVTPRPPEWLQFELGKECYLEDEFIDEEFIEDVEEVKTRSIEKSDHETCANNGSALLERGTSLSCPGVQTSGIAQIQVSNLNLLVKCVKCKLDIEVNNLKGTMMEAQIKLRAFHCEKCSRVIAIGFRKEFIHQRSHRLGFFDLKSCTINQLLPSNFLAQCAACCSEVIHDTEFKNVVGGQNFFTNCRACFKKMTIFIPEFKLLRISIEDQEIQKLTLKKKVEKERYKTGKELPLTGRCKHYRKSTRWFRFSCCAKVYPCDQCHDGKESHPSEHANRMICGACSREQNYRPEDCRFCANKFLKKNNTHYWEGGKGTRDQRLMSRNDPRKYKRVGK